MRLTVGPLPASVYWRRRAIVLAGGLLVLFLIAQACMAASAGGDAAGGDAAGGDTSGAPATATVRPDPTGTGADPDQRGATGQDGGPAGADEDGTDEGGAGPQDDPGSVPSGDLCTDDEIRVTARADRTEFTAGEPVQFTIVIRNDSDRTCRRDIGGSLRELSLVRGTGADRVWSSQDCGGPEGNEEVELPPGFENSYFLVWNGRASDTCDGDEPGGELLAAGEYRLFARLGSDHSDPVALTLLE